MALELQRESESAIDFIARMEPRITTILEQARRADPAQRWQEYSRLKRAGSVMVGWGASHPQLRQSWAYVAFIDALDEALPVYDESYSDEDES